MLIEAQQVVAVRLARAGTVPAQFQLIFNRDYEGLFIWRKLLPSTARDSSWSAIGKGADRFCGEELAQPDQGFLSVRNAPALFLWMPAAARDGLDTGNVFRVVGKMDPKAPTGVGYQPQFGDKVTPRK